MIGIIFGGESCEHDISIITALATFNSIKYKLNCILIYQKNGTFFIGKNLYDISFYKKFSADKCKEVYFRKGHMMVKSRLFTKKIKIDCILTCNHGGGGEGGSLAGYFDTVGIPYTSSNVFGSSLCMDKVFTKLMLEKYRFPTVNYRVFKEGYSVDKINNIEFPVVVKPSRLGSSVGISYVKNREELKEAIDTALQFDKKIIIEKALTDFREFNCAIFESSKGMIVSSVEEVITKKDYLDYEDKYISVDDTEHRMPAELERKYSEKITRMTREIYLLFELKGVVRIDYLMSEGKIYVNEINTIPGSLAAYMFKDKDIDIAQLVKETVLVAKKKAREEKTLVKDFSSNVLQYFDGIKGCGIKK